MKKLFFLSLITLLCLPVAVYAASIGEAETQGQGKFGIGMDQEFVFDRDMKLKSMSFELDPDGTLETKPEIDSMYRTMIKTSYGVLDNLDIYVKLGTADFKSEMPFTYTEPGDWETGIFKIKGKNAFAYGFGAKGKYEFDNDWIVGLDVQYLRHKNDFTCTESWEDSDGDSGVGSLKGDVTFQEWHVAPYIAKKLGNFVPYLGVKYSDLRTKFKMTGEDDDDSVTFKIEADDNVGVFLGTGYKIAENWSLNLEGRFIDETAMSFATVCKF